MGFLQTFDTEIDWSNVVNRQCILFALNTKSPFVGCTKQFSNQNMHSCRVTPSTILEHGYILTSIFLLSTIIHIRLTVQDCTMIFLFSLDVSETDKKNKSHKFRTVSRSGGTRNSPSQELTSPTGGD